MSAFCDFDISFLDNGSPLAEMSGTSNEMVTPIYSRDPDTSDRHRRKMTETPISPTPNEYNPIDNLLLPAGDSHIANIPREAGAPTNFQDNDSRVSDEYDSSRRQQANKKRKRERSNERKQKFRNKEKELVYQLRSLYDSGRQKNMTKHELLIEAIQEIKQCRHNHYESNNLTDSELRT